MGKVEAGYWDVSLFHYAPEKKGKWCEYLSGKLDELGTCLDDQLREIVAKAEKAVAKLTTAEDKCEALDLAESRVEDICICSNADMIRGADVMATKWLTYLEDKRKTLGLKTLKGTCDGCGNSPRNLKKSEYGQWLCVTCMRVSREQ
jgi:hypothetical protein